VKSLGLKTDLSTNFNFGSWIYTLLGAVHLPHQYCVELWNYLLSDDEAPFINFNPNETFTQADEHYNVSLRRFINYFQNQWTNEPNSSYVNQFLNQGCRTTNFAEGLNRKLRDIFHFPHPELGHFLDVMRQELESHTIQAERIINGQLPKLRKKAYRQAERRYINAKIILEDHFANNDINFEV